VISCSLSAVVDPYFGGDHCVSLPVIPSILDNEGEQSTLQWAINALVDNKGTPFMTINTMPFKKDAVTVSRSGHIKRKGSCTVDQVQPAICTGEYIMTYDVTFDAYHSSGDVPALVVIKSTVDINATSSPYAQNLCPVGNFSRGCMLPFISALDSFHGSFYKDAEGLKAIESIKGLQPQGRINLQYECESLVNILQNQTMFIGKGNKSVAYFSNSSSLVEVKQGQWLRFGNSSAQYYRQVDTVVNSTLFF
jgi:hypothetical protein